MNNRESQLFRKHRMNKKKRRRRMSRKCDVADVSSAALELFYIVFRILLYLQSECNMGGDVFVCVSKIFFLHFLCPSLSISFVSIQKWYTYTLNTCNTYKAAKNVFGYLLTCLCAFAISLRVSMVVITVYEQHKVVLYMYIYIYITAHV